MRQPKSIALAMALSVGLGASACGGASAAGAGGASSTVEVAHDPCDGADLSLGEAAEHCRVEGEVDAPPGGDAVEVVIATRALASGVDSIAHVTFRNTTADAIELSFPGSLRFESSLWSGERRVDTQIEMSGLAVGAVGCRAGADCRVVRVRLAPGGTLTASLPMSGRVVVLRDGASAGSLERSDGGAIPPGEYELRVMLPWMDAVEGTTTGARTPRIVRGPLTITH
jgi:hypothetical protein